MTERIAQLTRLTLEGRMLPKRITPEFRLICIFFIPNTLTKKLDTSQGKTPK